MSFMFSPNPLSAPVLVTGGKTRQQNGGHWSDEEHLQFLIGLKELGKGAWRDISRKYVPTRTPTQVASHSQKYFTKLAGANKRKRSTEKPPLLSRDAVPTSEDSSVESQDGTVLHRPETTGTGSKTAGSRSQRRCPEASIEARHVPAPLSLRIPSSALPSALPVLSPSDAYWQQTLKAMMRDQVPPISKIPSYPLGPLPPLAILRTGSCVGTSQERYASAAPSAKAFPRVSSFCSSDSVADSWGSSGVVRPEVKRASEGLPSSLRVRPLSPAVSEGSMSDDEDSMQTIAAADVLCTLRQSASSAFHEVYPGSPLSVA